MTRPSHIVDALLALAFCAMICAPLALGGCGSQESPRTGTAQAEATGAQARADGAGSAADQADRDAAAAAGRSAAADQAAKEQPTEGRNRAAAYARMQSAAASAVALALREQEARLRSAAREAQAIAARERVAEDEAQAFRAWVRLCRVLGLAGIVAGCLVGAAIGYLGRSPHSGAVVGGALSATGALVIAIGPATSWLPWLLIPAVLAALGAWAWHHLRETTAAATARAAAIAGSRAVDAIENEGRHKIDAAKASLGQAIAVAGMSEQVERLRGPGRDWSVA